jgi:predicted nucleic acid-binding Zn ribbon protein
MNRSFNRKREPADIQSVLRSVLRRYGLERNLQKYEFITRWKEVVGEDIASRTVPECIRGNCLIVRVESSAWAQELSFQKHVILKRFHKILRTDALKKGYVVKDIKFYT